MVRLTFIILIVAVVILQSCAQRTPRCGPNQVYRSCGTACPPTCRNPYPGPICPAVCVRGCQCIRGFYRRRDGRCVRRWNC